MQRICALFLIVAYAFFLGCSNRSESEASPTPVLSSITHINAGVNTTCAIVSNTMTNSVSCWGTNALNQLGTTATDTCGAYFCSKIPLANSLLSGSVTAIRQGRTHACAIVNGALYCWGDNTYGQLGNGTTTSTATPTLVTGMGSGVTSIATGKNHTCAIQSNSAYCWGLNASGELGDGTLTDRHLPNTVSGLRVYAVSIHAGNANTCVILDTGALRCWGYGGQGQVGNGSNLDVHSPSPVSGLTGGVTAVAIANATSGGHICAIVTGAVKCWGYNAYGQMGDGNTVNQNVPTAVSGITAGATDLAVGATHTCAVVNGGVKCWGTNTNGELGVTTSDTVGATPVSKTPADVTSLDSDYTNVAVGTTHSCALHSNGTMKCWGGNTNGELGVGTTTSSSTPETVHAGQ